MFATNGRACRRKPAARKAGFPGGFAPPALSSAGFDFGFWLG
jgi:hypothetical protein